MTLRRRTSRTGQPHSGIWLPNANLKGFSVDLHPMLGCVGVAPGPGDALETSMDIEFSADVLPEKYIGTPRAENEDYLMAIGLSGSLDDAFRKATSELSSWLQSDYKLSTSEAAIVLGTRVEYTISEVADRNVGVVAKIRRGTLVSLPQAK